MEEWRDVRDHAGYSVSNYGRVRNDDTGWILTMLRNQRGILNVGLMENGVQIKRSVARLVAIAFVPRPLSQIETFDTPIHLDGDQNNACALNLMWRPRWYAYRYHRQFRVESEITPGPVRDLETKEIYEDLWIPVIRYGILYMEIVLSAANRTVVWPTMQRFEWVEMADINPRQNRGI